MTMKFYLSIATAMSLAFLTACNSADDQGDALSFISEESAGVNCEFGGSRIDTGTDDNNNAVLDADEIFATEFLCDEPTVADLFSVEDVSLLETETANFQLALSQAWHDDLEFYFEANAETAERSVDFIEAFGQVSIPAGATSATVAVIAIPDALCESDETFSLNIVGHGIELAPVATITDVCDVDIDDDNLVEVYTLDNLSWMNNDLAGTSRTDNSGNVLADGCASVCNGYELMTDLDFDTNQDGLMNIDDQFFNSGQGWLPVGDYSLPFTANFDGNGFSIINLFIDRPEMDRVGLFGLVEMNGPTESVFFRNVNFNGDLTSVTGQDYTGTLIGWLEANDFALVDIDAIHVSGEVYGFDTNGAGGLIGRIDGETTAAANIKIDDVSFTGQISGIGSRAYYHGGIIGNLGIAENVDLALQQCRVDMLLTIGTTSYGYEIGGLFGRMESFGGDSIVADCHVSGAISNTAAGSGYDVGGLIGDLSLADDEEVGSDAQLTIRRSSVIADISTLAGGSSYYAGGFIGDLGIEQPASSLVIEDSFYSGIVSSKRYAGGLIAYSSFDVDASLTIENSYVVTEATASEAAIEEGALIGEFYSYELTELTKVSIQSSYFDSDRMSTTIGNIDGALTQVSDSDAAIGAPLADLQCPQLAEDPACSQTLYSGWDTSVWDFGDATQLPGLISDGVVYRDNNFDGIYD